MTRTLHALKIAFPGDPSHYYRDDGQGTVASLYRWECGCEAAGSDDEALRVACCTVHFPALAGNDPLNRISGRP